MIIMFFNGLVFCQTSQLYQNYLLGNDSVEFMLLSEMSLSKCEFGYNITRNGGREKISFIDRGYVRNEYLPNGVLSIVDTIKRSGIKSYYASDTLLYQLSENEYFQDSIFIILKKLSMMFLKGKNTL